MCVHYLVGNKTDLKDRKVSYEEAMTWAQERNFRYFEVSAKTNHNIDDMIQDIVNSITQKLENKEYPENNSLL